jgi:hypothetical protein
MKDLKLEIKNLKIAGGEETLRFQLNLYINKKHAATISNGGTGGPHEWLWLNDEARKLFNDHLAKLIAAHHFRFDFEQNDELIDEMIEELEIKQACKKHLCLKIKDEGGFRIMSEPDSPEARQWALALFAHKEFEYLNDRYPTPKSKTTLEFTPSEQKMINELAEALGISIKTLLESAISYIYFYREDKSILHKIEAYSQKTEESPNRSIELRLSLEPEDKLQQLGMEGKIKECAIIGLGLLYEGLIKDKRQGASAE